MIRRGRSAGETGRALSSPTTNISSPRAASTRRSAARSRIVFNCLNVFGLTLAENCCELPPGRLRRLCTRNLDFFLSKPIRQSQGCLAVGWTDHFEGLMETYSCAASPYRAAKGFAPLLLPPEHAFWHAPEEPLLSERGDYARVIKPAGLVVRSTAGAVEIINAGSQISNTMLRFGAWKWSKTAYRTGVGFTCAFPAMTTWSFDGALTAEHADGEIYGRHSTVAVELEESHVLYSYSLGFKTNQANTGVETAVWWRAGWLLQLHTFEARQPVVLRVGGYALPLKVGRVIPNPPGLVVSDVTSSAESNRRVRDNAPYLQAWSDDHRGTVLQPLHGFAAVEWDHRLDESKPRAHIAAPFHLTPVAKSQKISGPGWLAALVWTGTDRAEAAPWKIVSAAAGHWQLHHPKLGRWEIRHWALPESTAEHQAASETSPHPSQTNAG